MTVRRKKAAPRPPMKSVVKAAQAVPNPNQLTLDFKGRAAEKQKTRAGPRAKASPVRKAPAGIDIPKKPGD